jgi:hypothetical protein
MRTRQAIKGDVDAGGNLRRKCCARIYRTTNGLWPGYSDWIVGPEGSMGTTPTNRREAGESS